MSTQTPDRFEWTELDRRAVDTARLLAADAVEEAGNGHPGTAMSLAPAAYTHLSEAYAPRPRRSRAGPGGTASCCPAATRRLTLYIQLYLSGYELALDDLKAFRTWGSLTPGHPEYGHTAGVETTTGPLGQGVANAVGMAMAARYERGLFDPEAPEGESPFDHTVWAIVSDGDLEEGISSEAASLAGHQELGNLVFLYDDNHISIEGDTDVRVLRGRAGALRGLRLAHPARRARRRRRHRRRRPARGPDARAAGTAPPLDHRGPHDHRLARPERRRTPRRPTARRWAPTRSPPPRECSASTPPPPSRSPTRCSPTPARPSTGAARRTPRGTSSSPPGATANPSGPPSCSTGSSRASCPRAGIRAPGLRGGQGGRHPQGLR